MDNSSTVSPKASSACRKLFLGASRTTNPFPDPTVHRKRADTDNERILQAVYERKRQTSTFSLLDETNLDPIILGGYLEFLRSIYSTEIMFAFADVKKYLLQYDDMTQPQRLRTIQKFFKEFLSDDAPQQINISGTELNTIKNKLKILEDDPSHPVDREFLGKLDEEIRYLLTSNSFLKYQTSPYYELSSTKMKEFLEFSYEPFVEKKSISHHEWDILMTGSTTEEFTTGDYFIKEGKTNQYVYRLISGSVRVTKSVGDKEVILANVDKAGTVFGEISFLSNLPSTIGVIATSPLILQRVHTKLIVFLCCTSTDGPNLGKKCFINMATKLAKILVDLTNFEPSSYIFAREPSISAAVQANEKILNIWPKEKQKKVESPLVTLRKRFSKLSFSESIISSAVCWLKRKRKSRVYITSHHLLIFSYAIVSSTQIVISFNDINNIELDENIIKVHYEAKELEIKMENEEITEQHYNLLLSITSTIGSEVKGNPHLLEENFDLDNITDTEWNLLSNNIPIGKKNMKFSCVYFPGDIILQESVTMSHQIYRITTGTCQVYKRVPNPDLERNEPSKVHVATLQPGNIFGEEGFLLGIRSTATVAAETLVEVQIFDVNYLRDLFVHDPFPVLKFYYLVASNIAQLVVSRGDEGWTPIFDTLEQDQISDIKGKLQFARRNNKNFGSLWLEKEQSEEENSKKIKVSVAMDDGILYISNYDTGEQMLYIDLFLYVPVRKVNCFWLVKGSEILKFFPINDYVATWMHRLQQISYEMQSKFLVNSPVDFFESAKRFKNEIQRVHARVAIHDVVEDYTMYELVLQLDYIHIYREGIAVKLLNVFESIILN